MSEKRRTRSEVLAERENAVAGGCCDRFADNKACDCLTNALPDQAFGSTPAAKAVETSGGPSMMPSAVIENLPEFLQAFAEVFCQAGHDLCGEQREFHMPRLQRMFVLACTMFPRELVAAMEKAMTPYGEKVVS